jgi:RecA-family ATPase
MDPTIFFGPGERYVNDAEASLMQCARHISNELEHITVGYIHHMSKAATKNKDTDMHAGRSGSAFGDNARAVWVLHRYERVEGKDSLQPPNDIYQDDITDGRVGYLTVAKYSAGERITRPFWFHRNVSDGFDFKLSVQEERTDVEKKEDVEKKNNVQMQKMMVAIYDVVKKGQDMNANHNLTSLRGMKVQALGEKHSISDANIRTAVANMVRLNHLDQHKDESDGRKKYLACGIPVEKHAKG